MSAGEKAEVYAEEDDASDASAVAAPPQNDDDDEAEATTLTALVAHAGMPGAGGWDAQRGGLAGRGGLREAGPCGRGNAALVLSRGFREEAAPLDVAWTEACLLPARSKTLAMAGHGLCPCALLHTVALVIPYLQKQTSYCRGTQGSRGELSD